MLYYANGSPTLSITAAGLQEAINSLLAKYESGRKVEQVLAIPPDITRLQSMAGKITCLCDRYFADRLSSILPALGTHLPMTTAEIELMFPGVSPAKFREHRWQEDLVTLGRVPQSYIEELSAGRLHFDWPAQVNSLLTKSDLDLIVSIGQVVPHEVIGMANFNKNIFVGTGGEEGINKSHFVGANYGIEKTLGQINTPVRKLLNYASAKYAAHLPILYILTVVGVDDNGNTHLRGLYAGDDEECFVAAAKLSAAVNITLLDETLPRVVAMLDPHKFRSTWVGNKAIYRSRMAIADDGDLFVIAPGVSHLGESKKIDQLIASHGYLSTPEVLARLESDAELAANLGTVAHLIHGSSEGRFNIHYAAPQLGKELVEKINYNYADLESLSRLFQLEGKETGWHLDSNAEPFYYIKNPSLGLWSERQLFASYRID